MLEDNATDAELVERLLKKEKLDFEFSLAMNKDTFLRALDRFCPTVILADNSLPQFNAKEALEIVNGRSRHIPFILVTGSVSEEFAANIIKLGADDYILKDRLIRLPAAIDAAVKQQRVEMEKWEAQEESRKFSERVQTLSKATKDAIWDWDLLTDQVWWNESFYTLLGYDPELPVPGVYEWTKHLHADDRDKVIGRLRDIRKNLTHSWEDEFRFRLADGNYGTMLGRAYVLRDDSGTPVRAIGAFVDLSEQKRLLKEMEVLSLIAKETGNAVIIFDKGSWHTTWVNEGFTRHTGYTAQDMRGGNPSILLKGPGTDPRVFDELVSRIADSKPYTGDILIYTKSGEPRWHYVSGQPIYDDHKEARKYFIISTDVSERRRMEEERLTAKIEQQKEVTRAILQTQERERNQLGRELHDNINQILASVYLKLGFYLENPEARLPLIESCRQSLKHAIQEARNLSHQMVMPSFSEKDLRDELSMLIENYSYRKIVRLQTASLEEEKISDTLKETLFRIVQEQLSNIHKHANAEKIFIRLHSNPESVTLFIKDNGVGFDIHQNRKGIGITNIFNRVQSYNGTTDLISSPGRGCTLVVKIPLPR